MKNLTLCVIFAIIFGIILMSLNSFWFGLFCITSSLLVWTMECIKTIKKEEDSKRERRTRR